VEPGYNPNRTIDLFALTHDGYIIAQDILCQQEYIDEQCCPDTGLPLTVIAQINRSYQGLNEVVTISQATGKTYTFIFDISNEVYQAWWASQLGDLYVCPFDFPPRTADPTTRLFDEE
jgi:hypothetical protein